MKPICFSCRATLPLVPDEIARRILDLARWREFRGCWPVPGIRSAEFEVRTPEVVGTRFRVTNRDGSMHVEEITEWEPDHRVRLRLHEFPPPLSRLATGFDETWEFERVAEETTVTRSFRFHPSTALARIPLRLIAFFFRRAIVRHLRDMKAAANSEQTAS